MSIVMSSIQTICCDTCGKTITFDVKDAQKTVQETPWMLSVRTVVRLDNQQFVYCSDNCNFEGIKTGNHNIPEQKKIAEVTGSSAQAAIEMAAKSARLAEEATKAMKSGSGGKLQIV